VVVMLGYEPGTRVATRGSPGAIGGPGCELDVSV